MSVSQLRDIPVYPILQPFITPQLLIQSDTLTIETYWYYFISHDLEHVHCYYFPKWQNSSTETQSHSKHSFNITYILWRLVNTIIRSRSYDVCNYRHMFYATWTVVFDSYNCQQLGCSSNQGCISTSYHTSFWICIKFLRFFSLLSY